MNAALCLSGAVLALGVAGCAHTDRNNVFASGGTAKLLPMLVGVTTGPIAELLTNTASYSAEFALTSNDLSGKPLRLTGPALIGQDKLRMEFSKSNGKPMMMGDIDIIWDSANRKGYLLSEALQGYAPIYDMVRCTNLVMHVLAAPADREAGHPIDRAAATLQCGDGQTINLQVVRALDLANLPLRLQLVDAPDSFALALAKVKAVPLPNDIFTPPEDFSKFASAEALINELAARQIELQNGNRPPATAPGPHDPKFGGLPHTQ